MLKEHCRLYFHEGKWLFTCKNIGLDEASHHSDAADSSSISISLPESLPDSSSVKLYSGISSNPGDMAFDGKVNSPITAIWIIMWILFVTEGRFGDSIHENLLLFCQDNIKYILLLLEYVHVGGDKIYFVLSGYYVIQHLIIGILFLCLVPDQSEPDAAEGETEIEY